MSLKSTSTVVGHLLLLQVFFSAGPATSAEPFSGIATAQDMAPLLASRIRAVPDCTFDFTVERIAPVDENRYAAMVVMARAGRSGPPDVENIPVVTRRFEMTLTHYKGSFSFSETEKGILIRRISVDNGTFYYLRTKDGGGARLYTGKDPKFYTKTLSAALLTSPLYLVYQPFMESGDAPFYPPFCTTSDFWVHHLLSLTVANTSAEMIELRRETGDVQSTISYNIQKHIASTEYKVGTKMSGSTNIAEVVKVAPGIFLPSRYTIGGTYPSGKRTMGTSTFALTPGSFQLLDHPPKEGFVIPGTSAEDSVDSDLQLRITR